MCYETFKTTILQSLKETFQQEAVISMQTIQKNNHVQLDGLSIQRKNRNIAPTIYLNGYYEQYKNGMPFTKILHSILQTYEQNCLPNDFDISFFTDYQSVKSHIIYKLIHYEKNKELLQEIPHFPFLDLAIVFCCLLPNAPTGTATILIRNHHLDFWKITADTLYQCAHKNTPILLPYEFQSMEELFASFSVSMPLSLYTQQPDSFFPMYMLTNTCRLFGASALLYPDTLKTLAKFLRSDFYILPSSIHEVLLLPETHVDSLSTLNHIITMVNQSEVSAEEILSDHAYLYSKNDGLIIP